MLLVSYDISCDKLRTRFAKFLSKYGSRLQYSLFEIKNSKRVLDIIQSEVRARFEKQFSQNDSILVLDLNPLCAITRFGYAKNNEHDLLIT